MTEPDPERTYYSNPVKGDRGNYDREARFDYYNGYLGISQHLNGRVDRVLLTPDQMKAMVDFYNNPVDAAHAAFDVLWKTKQMKRSEAYRWLSKELGISHKKCHISWLPLEACRKVPAVVAARVET